MKTIRCFCFNCGEEWSGYSSSEMECGCELQRVAYSRPCVENSEDIDAVFISESSELLTLEQTVPIPMDEFPATIFGMCLPANTAIIKRNVLDFENHEVTFPDGSKNDLDSYYFVRDIGI